MVFTRELGGAEVVALQLAAAVRKKAGHCNLWVPGSGQVTTAAVEMGVSWRNYDVGDCLNKSRIQVVKSNWRIWRLLRSETPGLLHVHSPYHYGVLSLGLKMSRLKTVVHVQLEAENELFRWAFKRPPDIIMTCARFLSDRIRGIIPTALQDVQRIVTMPNAVDIDRFYPGDKSAAKVRFGVSRQTLLVLMVANLARHKGQETALRATALLKDRGMPVQLWLAGVERGGGQDFTNRLKLLARDLQIIEQVQFLGQQQDVPELLRAADCLLLPSTMEGLPLSILEAQACKTPVLAAPTSGILEIVTHGKTGFLIPADDAVGYAHHLYGMHQDRAPYGLVAEKAHAAVVSAHTWKDYFARVWETYEALLCDRSKYLRHFMQLICGIVSFYTSTPIE